MEDIGSVENIERNKVKSEAIPSLLLVNDDIISPITVLFDTTKLISTGDHKPSQDDSPLPITKSNSKEENSTWNLSGEAPILCKSKNNNNEGCRSFSQEVQSDKDHSVSNVSGLKVDRKTQRRRSDCPHRSQALDEEFFDGSTLGSMRIKAKSIERASDLDRASHEPGARGIVPL